MWIKWPREGDRFGFCRMFRQFFTYKIRLGQIFHLSSLILRKDLAGYHIFDSLGYLNIESKALALLECWASDRHTDDSGHN